MSRKLTWCWLALLVLAAITRLAGLGERVMSHDESIHVLTAWNTLQQGPYIHDPVYHGPLLYVLNRIVFELGGSGDFAGRLAPACAGILLVLVPFLFRRELGERGALISSLLLLVSPSVSFYSRYNRHDVLAVLLALVLFRLLWSLQQRRGFNLAGIAVCFAGLLLTKEVSYIYGALFGAGLGLVGLAQWRWGSAASLFHAWRGPLTLLLLVAGLLTPFVVVLLGHDPLDFSRQGLLYIMPLYIMITIITTGLGVVLFGTRWLAASVFFYVLLLMGYTWFGQNPAGIYSGLFGSLGYWLSQHEVARGGQPAYFYGLLTLLYEFPVLCLVLVSLPACWKHRNKPITFMLLFWLLGSAIIYSWAGEKMPWLMMHLVVPACLLIGWALRDMRLNAVVPLLSAAVMALSALSWRVNVAHANHPNELIQYAAGHQDVKKLLHWVDEVDRVSKAPLVIGCGTDLAWPFNWYFRQRSDFHWQFPDLSGSVKLDDYDLLLVSLEGWMRAETRVIEAWGGPIRVVHTRLGLTHWPDQQYRKPLGEHLEDVRDGRSSLNDGLHLLLHGQPFSEGEEWGTQTTFILVVRNSLYKHPGVAWPF